MDSKEEPPIHKLNDYCMMKIFTFLDMDDKLKVEKVCKRWDALALDSWISVKKFVADVKLSEAQFSEYITRCGPHLDSLSFYILIPNSSLLVMEHCSNLRDLTIMVESILNDHQSCIDMCLMLEKLSTLKSVRLRSIYGPKSKELTLPLRLSRKRANHLTDELLKPEFCGFCNLETLILHNVHFDCDVRGFENMKNLRILELNDAGMADELMSNIFVNSRNLEHITLCNLMSGPEIFRALSTLPRLKSLSLSRLSHAVVQFMHPVPSLVYLNCRDNRRAFDKKLGELLELTPNLRYLDLMECEGITKRFAGIVEKVVESRDNDVGLTIRTDKSFRITKCTRLTVRKFYYGRSVAALTPAMLGESSDVDLMAKGVANDVSSDELSESDDSDEEPEGSFNLDDIDDFDHFRKALIVFSYNNGML